jgi:hypothetical protein
MNVSFAPANFDFHSPKSSTDTDFTDCPSSKLMVGKEKDKPTIWSFAHRQMSFTAALMLRKRCQYQGIQ